MTTDKWDMLSAKALPLLSNQRGPLLSPMFKAHLVDMNWNLHGFPLHFDVIDRTTDCIDLISGVVKSICFWISTCQDASGV